MMAGCASVEVTRKASFLSEDFNNQIQRNITMVSLIDVRPDKEKDIEKVLLNRNVRSYFMSSPLEAKGYKVQLFDTDTSRCASLVDINPNEFTCLDNTVFQNGDLFLLVSIDQYIAPKAMHVIGHTKITGVMYSKSLNSFIWKDTIEGDYGGTGSAYSGLGGFVGMLTLKAMSQDLILRNNVYTAVSELFKSIPPYKR